MAGRAILKKFVDLLVVDVTHFPPDEKETQLVASN